MRGVALGITALVLAVSACSAGGGVSGAGATSSTMSSVPPTTQTVEDPERSDGGEQVLDAREEQGVEEDELDGMARVTNASDLLPEDREIVRELLSDMWVAGVDGPLRVGVVHEYSTEPGLEGVSAVTFDFVTPSDTRGFSFDWDACGTQPDVVNGVRYIVDPQGVRNRAGEPWVIKSFTWEGEAGARHSCV